MRRARREVLLCPPYTSFLRRTTRENTGSTTPQPSMRNRIFFRKKVLAFPM
jgi:hypothetical protein